MHFVPPVSRELSLADAALAHELVMQDGNWQDCTYSIDEPVDLMYFGVSFLAYLARSLRCAKKFILETTQGVVPVVKFSLRLGLERKSY